MQNKDQNQQESLMQNASILLSLSNKVPTTNDKFTLTIRNKNEEEHDNVQLKRKLAAEALAAAATIPLPLKEHSKVETSRKSTQNLLPKARKNTHSRTLSTLKISNMITQPDNDTNNSINKTPPTVTSEKFIIFPTPDSYIVEEDDLIITCICELDVNDNELIKCQHCNRWQHANCYIIALNLDKKDQIPISQHYCNVCKPRKLNNNKVKERQWERIQALTSYPSPNANLHNVNSDNNHHHILNHKLITFNSTGPVSYDNNNNNHNGSNLHLSNNNKNINQFNNNNTSHNNNIPYPINYNNFKFSHSQNFKDKYVKDFIIDHQNDDWVKIYPYNVFIPFEVEPRHLSSMISSPLNHDNKNLINHNNKFGLFLKKMCKKGDFLHEVLGEVDFQQNYTSNPKNHYRIWAVPKPKNFFHDHWPIYIACKKNGNLTRFIRRSCNPNVKLTTIKILPRQNTQFTTNNNNSNNIINNGEEYKIKFVLMAIRDIKSDEELTIDWQWDLRHPIWKLINGTSTFENLSQLDKFNLILSIDTILSTTDCACPDTDDSDCILKQIKKKSTRFRSKSKFELEDLLRDKLLGNNNNSKKLSISGNTNGITK